MATLVTTFAGLPSPDSERPVCIIARTTKGKGVSLMEAAPRAWHVGCLSPAERDDAIAEITARMQAVSA